MAPFIDGLLQLGHERPELAIVTAECEVCLLKRDILTQGLGPTSRAVQLPNKAALDHNGYSIPRSPYP